MGTEARDTNAGFQLNMYYETNTGLPPPGRKPAGTRWSGARVSETNPKLKRWMLVSRVDATQIDELTVQGPGQLVSKKISPVIIPDSQKLSLHHPNNDAPLVEGED